MAKKFLETGHYFWNANQFVWRADSFLKAVAKYAPEINKHLAVIKDSIGKSWEKKTFRKEFEEMPKISVVRRLCSCRKSL
jgi:mannose-1-phosphate guanylyltransferase